MPKRYNKEVFEIVPDVTDDETARGNLKLKIPNFWRSFLESGESSQALCWQIYEQAHEVITVNIITGKNAQQIYKLDKFPA